MTATSSKATTATAGHGAENLGGGTPDHGQRTIAPPTVQPKQKIRGDKGNPYPPGGNTQPAIQRTEPGGQEYQRAVASFNQGQYFFPTNDSALYWDQVAIKAGNANAQALEPQISKKYVKDGAAVVWCEKLSRGIASSRHDAGVLSRQMGRCFRTGRKL